MTKSEKTNVNEELLEFLKFSYFGNLKNPIEAASNRAYRDMCRTLKFDVLPKDTKATIISDLKEAVNVIFKEEIPIINEGGITSPEKFDSWHCKVCENIKLLYNEKGIEFTCGQAQKWVNMTIKYLYILKDYNFDSVFEYLHIPVDKYILEIANKKLGIDAPTNAWSRWDNYKEYKDYQKAIRKKLKEKTREKSDIDTPPLLWEFKNWLEVAKANNNNN